MKLLYEDLIDQYRLGELTDEDRELFWLSLEYSKQLRDEFNFFLKMKCFLIDGEIRKVDKFLIENGLK